MRRLLFAAIAIPLTTASGWKDLKFNHIPANKIEFSEAGLKIKVENSSSPLIYPLNKTMLIKGFKADLEITGELNSSPGQWPEDAYLRMGFVAPGERRLGMMEKMLASAWIKQLFKLAPEGSGVDKIYFFSLVTSDQFVGQKRILPKSKNLIEEFIVMARPGDQKNMTFQYQFTKPFQVTALWLSADGDDTHSRFQLAIKRLSLEE